MARRQNSEHRVDAEELPVIMSGAAAVAEPSDLLVIRKEDVVRMLARHAGIEGGSLATVSERRRKR